MRFELLEKAFTDSRNGHSLLLLESLLEKTDNIAAGLADNHLGEIAKSIGSTHCWTQIHWRFTLFAES